MTKFILLSGLKGSGKDTVISILKPMLNGTPLHKAECKDHLHDLTMTIFNCKDIYWKIYNDRLIKEVPLNVFKIPSRKGRKLFDLLKYGKYYDLEDIVYIDSEGRRRLPNIDDKYELSVREAIIYVSEIFYKPLFGKDIFGKIRASGVGEGIYYDASYGFEEELQPLVDKIGKENIIGIMVNNNRVVDKGGDSRKLLREDQVGKFVTIENNGDMQNLTDEIIIKLLPLFEE